MDDNKSTVIPPRPDGHSNLKAYEPPAGVTWDPDLSAVRVEGDRVLGVACGIRLAQGLAPGDVYYRLVSAAFIDEIEAQGRHSISVDVIDEAGRRLDGAQVYHGWPTHLLPEYDTRVVATIFGGVLAHWDLYAGFDAWQVVGPYWVQCAGGPSDLFYGAGLPWNRHVCFAVAFQRTVWQAEQPPVDPPVDPPANGQIVTLLTSVDANLRARRAHLGA